MVINIDDPKALFEYHFSEVSNKRILFSGKFGSGKTYFLKEFFTNESNSNNTFWLSPVKYSVGLNEDIFEYIKFDLALKLIAMPELSGSKAVKYNEDQYLYQFLSSQPLVAFDTLFLLLESLANDESTESKLIKFTATAIEKSRKLIEKYNIYKKFKEEIVTASKSHTSILTSYLKDSVLHKGSIYEDDIISQTIRTALEICKIQSHKNNVLIIDDFDRLDPEHVFRILNILSVHNDMYDEDNKFSFDKIIIVCDYENIEKIYAHKYGIETNFLGYISKFYSTEVFHFNNSKAINNFCKTQLSIVKNEYVQDVLGLLLSIFVERNYITMRDIVKTEIPIEVNIHIYGPYQIYNFPEEYQGYYEIKFKNQSFIKADIKEFKISSEDYPFIKALRILCIIFGGYSKLKSALEDLLKEYKGNYPRIYFPKIVKSILPLLHHARNWNESSKLCLSFSGDSNKHYLYLDKPFNSFFGTPLPLPLSWDNNNQFDNTVSLYKGINEILKDIDYSKVSERSNTTYISFFQQLVDILLFLDSSGTLQTIGVSKSNM